MRSATMAMAAATMLASLSGQASATPPLADAAAVALHVGNASNAAALATQALADTGLSPHDRARVLVDRGLAYEALGERDAALVDFTEAIEARALSPAEQARALYDRGVTLDELSRTDDALGDYSAAIRVDPRFAAALNNRANAYRRLGKAAQARADYQASIAAGNPRLEYPEYGLGQIAEATGDAEGARRYYRAALAANPQFALAADRLAALAGAVPPSALAPAPPPSAGDVHLKPPPPAVTDAPAPSGESAPIQLRPPGAVRLKPSGAVRPAAAVHPLAGSEPPPLKPALGGRGAGSGSVQLGAWRSQGDAANAWSRIARVAGSLLSGLTPQVVAADLPGKGRFYRLRTGPTADPGTLCRTLEAKGIACLVVRD